VSEAREEETIEDVDVTPLPVDPTGVPNLDLMLGGGVPRGALVLVVGPPGSGKTTLANQMAFTAARAGRRVLILTALSEPTNKFVANLRSLSFFDEEFLGDAIQVLSLAAVPAARPGGDRRRSRGSGAAGARQLRDARRLPRHTRYGR